MLSYLEIPPETPQADAPCGNELSPYAPGQSFNEDLIDNFDLGQNEEIGVEVHPSPSHDETLAPVAPSSPTSRTARPPEVTVSRYPERIKKYFNTVIQLRRGKIMVENHMHYGERDSNEADVLTMDEMLDVLEGRLHSYNNDKDFIPFSNFTEAMMVSMHVNVPLRQKQFNILSKIIHDEKFQAEDFPTNYNSLGYVINNGFTATRTENSSGA